VLGGDPDALAAAWIRANSNELNLTDVGSLIFLLFWGVIPSARTNGRRDRKVQVSPGANTGSAVEMPRTATNAGHYGYVILLGRALAVKALCGCNALPRKKLHSVHNSKMAKWNAQAIDSPMTLGWQLGRMRCDFVNDPDYRPLKELRLRITTNANAVLAPEFEWPES